MWMKKVILRYQMSANKQLIFALLLLIFNSSSPFAPLLSVGVYGQVDSEWLDLIGEAYTSTELGDAKSDSLGVVAFDANGDGAIDLFISNYVMDVAMGFNNENELLINDGFGNFTDATKGDLIVSPNINMSRGPAIAFDADGDGDLDLFIPTVGMNQLLLNDGLGNFTLMTSGDIVARRVSSQRALAFDADGGTPFPDIMHLKYSFMSVLCQERY